MVEDHAYQLHEVIDPGYEERASDVFLPVSQIESPHSGETGQHSIMRTTPPHTTTPYG